MVSVSAIDDALQSEDIEGLLELGAPKDEYSHEAEAIASELKELTPDAVSEDRVAATIARVWAKSFELSDEDMQKRYEAVRRVARQILSSCPEGSS